MDFETADLLTDKICEAIAALAGGELSPALRDALQALQVEVTSTATNLANTTRRFERVEMALRDRLDANEQAVQSCISTLGDVQKIVQRLAENQADRQ